MAGVDPDIAARARNDGRARSRHDVGRPAPTGRNLWIPQHYTRHDLL